MPMNIYNWKWHQRLTGWKLKIISWTGGHYDTERTDKQIELVKAPCLNVLLKCSGTEIANTIAAVIIKFQILVFC